jgi:SAM-dependent methyltransferase
MTMLTERTTAMPTTAEMCLPDGYRQRTTAPTRDDSPAGTRAYWNPERIADCQRRAYQLHVYRWAARLVRSRKIVSVLDVGCGPGWKLSEHICPLLADVTGIDQPSALAVGRASGVRGRYLAMDLQRPDDLGRSFGLVMCVDVIEHLIDPRPLVGFLRRCAGPDGLVLLSTPERDRHRGVSCRSADKPEHVREWSRGEFVRFVESQGLVVERSRLMPHDSASFASLRSAERAFRSGQAERGGLSCHAVLCRVS